MVEHPLLDKRDQRHNLDELRYNGRILCLTLVSSPILNKWQSYHLECDKRKKKGEKVHGHYNDLAYRESTLSWKIQELLSAELSGASD